MNLDPQWILIVQSTRPLITEVPSSSSCKSIRMGYPIWRMRKLMSYQIWLKSSYVNNKNSKSKSIFSNWIRLSIQEWVETRWALQQERDRLSPRRHRNGFLEKECLRIREATNWWCPRRTAKEVRMEKMWILGTTLTFPSQISQVSEIQRVT